MNRTSALVVVVLAGVLALLAAPVALADDAVEFFKSHPNAIDFQESPSRLLFANRQIGLEFETTANSIRLKRMYSIADGQDLLADAGTRDLFEIRMALDPKFVGKDLRGQTQPSLMGIVDEMAADAFSAAMPEKGSVAWRREGNAAESTLVLEWKGLDAKDAAGVIDAQVTVRLLADDPLSYWRINVRNRGDKYGIERVRFPVINLAPIGPAEQNVLIYPQSRGRLVNNPFTRRSVNGYYTCDFEMQFHALYNEQSGIGVYFATQQSVPCLSHMRIDCNPTHIEWAHAYFPPNITFAQDAPGDDAEDFVAPYDCVIGPFRGDWWDACQVYRKWALRQSWCGKGPLISRQDVPRWYKEAPLYFYTTFNDSGEGTHSMDENLRIAADQFRQWLNWAGMKLPLNVYAWEEPVNGMSIRDLPFHRARSAYTSKSGRWSGMTGHNFYDGNYPVFGALKKFADECRSLREAGGMVSPYVALELFNPGPTDNAPFATEAKPHTIRDLFGCIRTWGGDGAWQMCSASPWWRDRLVETCRLLLEREHVGGLYLDVMRGSCLPCYWTPHGHTAAGGDSMTTTRHALVKSIRDMVRAKDPDAIMTGENPSENMIDVIDGMLVYTLWPDSNAPLLAAVYQDYIKRYGLEVSTGAGYRNRFAGNFDDNAFFIECASLFVEGTQIGRIRLKPRDASLSLDNPAQKPMIDFLQRVVSYYKNPATRDYLAYGQLMRPLVFSSPAAMPTVKYKSGGDYPALMSGVFRLADGSMGAWVVNASDQAITFTSSFDPTKYELPSDVRLGIEQITPDGAVIGEPGSQSHPTLGAALEPRGMTMFRIRPLK